MDGFEKATRWFSEGRMVRPSRAEPNFVDLTMALFRLAGVDGLAETPASADFARRIGEARCHVLVIVDGLGVNMLSKAPEGGFLRSRLQCEFQAVFPPTTAAAQNAGRFYERKPPTVVNVIAKNPAGRDYALALRTNGKTAKEQTVILIYSPRHAQPVVVDAV